VLCDTCIPDADRTTTRKATTTTSITTTIAIPTVTAITTNPILPTTTTTTTTTTLYDPENVDCVEQQDACTAACESAAQRTYSLLTPAVKKGKACIGPADCLSGEGACPTTTTTTTVKQFTEEEVEKRIAAAIATLTTNLTECTTALEAKRLTRLAEAAEELAKFNVDESVGGDPTAGGPNIAAIVTPIVVVLLLVVGAIVFYRNRNHHQRGDALGKGHALVQRRAAQTVQNATFVPPPDLMQAPYGPPGVQIVQLQAPYAEHEAPPAVQAQDALYTEATLARGAEGSVPASNADYLEADPKRGPVYDAGNLAGAASHALRDKRRASQLAEAAAAAPPAYEEIDENIASAAGGGTRQSSVGAADWCHRPSPTGSTCTNAKVHGSNFCTTHLCEQAGCTEGKSSRVTACPAHLVAVAAGGNARQPRLRASSNAGSVLPVGSVYKNDAYSNVPGSNITTAHNPSGGQGIRRNSDARKKGSVYEGFGAGGAAGDDDDLDC